MLKVGDWIEITNPRILTGNGKSRFHKIRRFASLGNKGRMAFSGIFEDKAPFYLDESEIRILTPEEVKDKGLDEESDFVQQEPNDGVKTVSHDEDCETKKPYTKFLFVEDGSVLAETIRDIEERNPEIKTVVYRQGAQMPQLVDIKEQK